MFFSNTRSYNRGLCVRVWPEVVVCCTFISVSVAPAPQAKGPSVLLVRVVRVVMASAKESIHPERHSPRPCNSLLLLYTSYVVNIVTYFTVLSTNIPCQLYGPALSCGVC